ncbi:uncharacterized protein C8Q71DRAFT_862808 [Rhodofomes roseus]|uniref:Uncharacterized protein n=1 Tax=Rhodofomes roseus TaxID=34475 RepID=A0ABQ8JZZ6_9APHY|nr:uncharacterized protein C8Q71DRAFT_862808 [Rhodofomes roseus]KAH9829948.1 hypothetical protein C8Q71DRAFT_862808 [Rhodofomes roseus]
MQLPAVAFPAYYVLATLFLMKVICAQELHTVYIVNNCGKGYPVLGGLYGEFYPTTDPTTTLTFQGPAWGLLSYLQYTDDDGNNVCGKDGEGCTMVEATLSNTGSSVDITLIPPHAFSVGAGFAYYGGCNGAGMNCTSAACPGAKHNASEGWLQVSCTSASVSLEITFCQ